MKAAVGVANVVRGVIGTASGAAMFVTGEGAKGLGAVGLAVGIPVSVMGSAKMAFGIANVNRGAQQLSESVDSPSGASVKNLWGLAPFGQRFDDPAEPDPIRFAEKKVNDFVLNPVRTVVQTFKEFFAAEKP